MLSTRVCTLPGRTAAHTWLTALLSSATVEGGSSMSRIQTDIWSHTCSIEFMSRLPAGQSMASTSCWSKKATVSRAVWGGALSWTYTKLRPNTPVAHRPWQHLIPHDLDVPMPVHACPPVVVNWTPYHEKRTDGPRFPSLGWTQASISLSPCLRRTRTRPPLWHRENRDSSLKIQLLHCLTSHTLCLPPPHPYLPHNYSIVWGPTLCASPPPTNTHTHTLTAASPVLQSEPRTSGWTPRPISGGLKPSPNGSNWHPPPKSADHLHSQTKSQNEAVCSDHSEQMKVFPWRGDFRRASTLPLMWSASLSVASQNFANATLRHPQHPCYFPLRITICRQPDNSLQYLHWQILLHDPL